MNGPFEERGRHHQLSANKPYCNTKVVYLPLYLWRFRRQVPFLREPIGYGVPTPSQSPPRIYIIFRSTCCTENLPLFQSLRGPVGTISGPGMWYSRVVQADKYRSEIENFSPFHKDISNRRSMWSLSRVLFPLVAGDWQSDLESWSRTWHLQNQVPKDDPCEMNNLFHEQ
jgi:hypothetical protein